MTASLMMISPTASEKRYALRPRLRVGTVSPTVTTTKSLPSSPHTPSGRRKRRSTALTPGSDGGTPSLLLEQSLLALVNSAPSAQEFNTIPPPSAPPEQRSRKSAIHAQAGSEAADTSIIKTVSDPSAPADAFLASGTAQIVGYPHKSSPPIRGTFMTSHEARRDPTGKYRGAHFDPDYASKRGRGSPRGRKSPTPRGPYVRSGAYPQPDARHHETARAPRQLPKEGIRPVSDPVLSADEGQHILHDIRPQKQVTTPTQSLFAIGTTVGASPLDSLAKLQQFKAEVEASRARNTSLPEIQSTILASIAESFLMAQQGSNELQQSMTHIAPVDASGTRQVQLKEQLVARQVHNEPGEVAKPCSSGSKRVAEVDRGTEEAGVKRARVGSLADRIGPRVEGSPASMRNSSPQPARTANEQRTNFVPARMRRSTSAQSRQPVAHPPDTSAVRGRNIHNGSTGNTSRSPQRYDQDGGGRVYPQRPNTVSDTAYDLSRRSSGQSQARRDQSPRPKYPPKRTPSPSKRPGVNQPHRIRDTWIPSSHPPPPYRSPSNPSDVWYPRESCVTAGHRSKTLTSSVPNPAPVYRQGNGNREPPPSHQAAALPPGLDSADVVQTLALLKAQIAKLEQLVPSSLGSDPTHRPAPPPVTPYRPHTTPQRPSQPDPCPRDEPQQYSRQRESSNAPAVDPRPDYPRETRATYQSRHAPPSAAPQPISARYKYPDQVDLAQVTQRPEASYSNGQGRRYEQPVARDRECPPGRQSREYEYNYDSRAHGYVPRTGAPSGRGRGGYDTRGRGRGRGGYSRPEGR